MAGGKANGEILEDSDGSRSHQPDNRSMMRMSLWIAIVMNLVDVNVHSGMLPEQPLPPRFGHRAVVKIK